MKKNQILSFPPFVSFQASTTFQFPLSLSRARGRSRQPQLILPISGGCGSSSPSLAAAAARPEAATSRPAARSGGAGPCLSLAPPSPAANLGGRSSFSPSPAAAARPCRAARSLPRRRPWLILASVRRSSSEPRAPRFFLPGPAPLPRPAAPSHCSAGCARPAAACCSRTGLAAAAPFPCPASAQRRL